jgi:hypothetical protein
MDFLGHVPCTYLPLWLIQEAEVLFALCGPGEPYEEVFHLQDLGQGP